MERQDQWEGGAEAPGHLPVEVAQIAAGGDAVADELLELFDVGEAASLLA